MALRKPALRVHQQLDTPVIRRRNERSYPVEQAMVGQHAGRRHDADAERLFT
jgi:hypothetical protein